MEQKNVIAWDIQKGERSYRLELPMDAPLGEAYDVAREYLAKVIDLVQSTALNKENAEKEEAPEEQEAAAESE